MWEEENENSDSFHTYRWENNEVAAEDKSEQLFLLKWASLHFFLEDSHSLPATKFFTLNLWSSWPKRVAQERCLWSFSKSVHQVKWTIVQCDIVLIVQSNTRVLCYWSTFGCVQHLPAGFQFNRMITNDRLYKFIYRSGKLLCNRHIYNIYKYRLLLRSWSYDGFIFFFSFF
jgi:hypothetical protein